MCIGYYNLTDGRVLWDASFTLGGFIMDFRKLNKEQWNMSDTEKLQAALETLKSLIDIAEGDGDVSDKLTDVSTGSSSMLFTLHGDKHAVKRATEDYYSQR